ncbi:MAG: hypothetical protein M0Z75_01210 [Nitrospiraceae bacterium]|nr:hypothetical protein [Nitrospiraceae bacterium]
MEKRVYKISGLGLAALTAISAFFMPVKIPAGILAGGLLMLANFKALSWGVTGFLGAKKATGKMILFSGLRFAIILTVLIVLLKLRLVDLLGVILGMTVVFTVILAEGGKELLKRVIP